MAGFLQGSFDRLNPLMNDHDNCFYINTGWMKELGVKTAALLGYLSNVSQRAKNDEHPENDGWFPCTVDKVQTETKLSADQQTLALKKLVEVGLIETKRKGLPARRYIRIAPTVAQMFLTAQLTKERVGH